MKAESKIVVTWHEVFGIVRQCEGDPLVAVHLPFVAWQNIAKITNVPTQ